MSEIVNEAVSNIPGRLHSAATNHIVTGANEIYDDDKHKRQSEINAEQEALNAKIPVYTETTWAALKALRDNSQLVPGAWYRITDYQCTTTQENTQSAGHQFDIIVRADGVNVLNENASAAKHAGDTYFANCNLAAWELKYTIDNDTTKFIWADSTNGKGVIYWMKDEWNNECPYDFKNIQFKRYKLKGGNYLHLADEIRRNSKYRAAADLAFNLLKNALGTYIISDINNNNRALYYTRGIVEDEGYVLTGSEIGDYSEYDSYDNGNLIFNAQSGGNYVGVAYIDGAFDVIAEITNTTGEWFYTFTSTLTTAFFDASLRNDNTVQCYNNKIKEFSSHGVRSLNGNIILGTKMYKNSFGIDCINNTLGENCINNTFGANSSYNTFSSNCYNNIINDNCNRNIFIKCTNNVFIGQCNSNIFGSYSNGNILAKNNYGNVFANGCEGNSFGSYCHHVVFSKTFCCYNVVEPRNSYIILTSTQTTSDSSMLRNIKICQGVNNTEDSKTIFHDTINDIFQTEYKSANSQVISV